MLSCRPLKRQKLHIITQKVKRIKSSENPVTIPEMSTPEPILAVPAPESIQKESNPVLPAPAQTASAPELISEAGSSSSSVGTKSTADSLEDVTLDRTVTEIMPTMSEEQVPVPTTALRQVASTGSLDQAESSAQLKSERNEDAGKDSSNLPKTKEIPWILI
jgi:hypothetical protein